MDLGKLASELHRGDAISFSVNDAYRESRTVTHEGNDAYVVRANGKQSKKIETSRFIDYKNGYLVVNIFEGPYTEEKLIRRGTVVVDAPHAWSWHCTVVSSTPHYMRLFILYIEELFLNKKQ